MNRKNSIDTIVLFIEEQIYKTKGTRFEYTVPHTIVKNERMLSEIIETLQKNNNCYVYFDSSTSKIIIDWTYEYVAGKLLYSEERDRLCCIIS
jgi:hypothetical protein